MSRRSWQTFSVPRHLPKTLRELVPGQQITPTLKLNRPLSKGAMGSVWVAEHLTLRTEVAVKFISDEMPKDSPEILERFQQEAATTAQIKSPHVVQTFDQGFTDDETPYIVMELLDGEDLGERLERDERLSTRDTAQIVVQVAKALGRAHELGIVHRDIKPENIFLCDVDDGMFVKILDFGIAKATQLPKKGLTTPGRMVGTPEFMSPEMLSTNDEVDHRADLWALGVVAYLCLVGDIPFFGTTVPLLCIEILQGKCTPPSSVRDDLPDGIDEFFDKALAKKPADRFQSAKEMARAFSMLLKPSERDSHVEVTTGSFSIPRGLRNEAQARFRIATGEARTGSLVDATERLRSAADTWPAPESRPAPDSSRVAGLEPAPDSAPSSSGDPSKKKRIRDGTLAGSTASAMLPGAKGSGVGKKIALVLALAALLGGAGFYVTKYKLPAPVGGNATAEPNSAVEGLTATDGAQGVAPVPTGGLAGAVTGAPAPSEGVDETGGGNVGADASAAPEGSAPAATAEPAETAVVSPTPPPRYYPRRPPPAGPKPAAKGLGF